MPKHQYSLELIQRAVNDSIIEQRAIDGYINATALCKAAEKEWAHYHSNKSTKEFLAELSTDLGIPMSDIIQSVKGGSGQQGTYVHPQVAINLAQWLSAKFAVKVSKWVYEWKVEGSKKPTALPAHIIRYTINDPKIPNGYFSMLQETILGLIAPLHNLGFEIPSGWVPDISVGKAFCKYLRDVKGVDTTKLPTYIHEYQDIRGAQHANLYPDEYLAECRLWFKTVWLPINGSAYFKKKDPSCLQFFDKLPAIANPKNAANLPSFKNRA